MLKKKPIRKSKKTSVVFEIEGLDKAKAVNLAGDFNEWEPSATPMKRRKDGAWSVTVRLDNDSQYQYRYVVDGQDWVVDPDADALVANPFGGHNSLVVIP